MSIVEFKDVTRIYTSGEHKQKALDNVNFTLDEGKFIVILGPSGAGKSTILNMLGGLDSPTNGTILVDGKDISKLSNNELADYRANMVGFVFQFYNLIPTLTVYENVVGQLEQLEQSIFELETFPEKFRVYEKEPWHSRGLRAMPYNLITTISPVKGKKYATFSENIINSRFTISVFRL